MSWEVYSIINNFNYRLAEISRHLVILLEALLKPENIMVETVLRHLSLIEVHLENIRSSQEEIKKFQEIYNVLRKNIEEKYEDIRTTLSEQDRVRIRIESITLLECILSLMVTGVKSFIGLSDLIPSKKFPKILKVRIGRQEIDMDKTFVIGRVSEKGEDYICIRVFPYNMKLSQLKEIAKNEEKIKSLFTIRLKSEIKLESRFGVKASRIHVIIYYDETSQVFRILDASSSETIVEIDGEGHNLIGLRTVPDILQIPQVVLPLGKNNKIWIDPLLKMRGTPVEIIIK
jgi:hypothetical protein